MKKWLKIAGLSMGIVAGGEVAEMIEHGKLPVPLPPIVARAASAGLLVGVAALKVQRDKDKREIESLRNVVTILHEEVKTTRDDNLSQ
jgi:hypothetical protein